MGADVLMGTGLGLLLVRSFRLLLLYTNDSRMAARHKT